MLVRPKQHWQEREPRSRGAMPSQPLEIRLLTNTVRLGERAWLAVVMGRGTRTIIREHVLLKNWRHLPWTQRRS